MTLTETQIKSDLQEVTQFFDQIRLFGAVNSGTLGTQAVTNLIAQQTSCTNAFLGDWIAQKATALQSARDAVAASITGPTMASVYRWTLRDYAQYLDVPETDPAGIFARIYDDYVANSKSVMSRGFTFGSSSAGASNVGNGVIVRLNTDESGFILENQVADAKSARCVTDANNGAGKWEEVFEVRGGTAAKDQLTITGSGKKANLTAISARQSANIVKNPSWSQTSPAGPSTSLTAITSWTSDVTVSTTYYDSIGGTGVNGYYRDFPGDTTPLALRIKGNVVLSQNLESQRSVFRENQPYLVQLAWRRKGSATGNLILRLGNQSVTATIGSGTNDVWNTLRFSGTQCWFKNFDKAGLTVSIETTSLAVSNVDVDDLLIVPMTKFDGSWYAFVGTPATDTPTQWLRNDTFTWTDTELGEGYGVMQKMFCWRAFGQYLPAIPITPSTGPAAALAGAGAGNVDNGIHYYRFTFVDTNGIESGLSASANATVVDKTSDGKVALTSIDVGPSNTASRKVYRTVAAAADSVGNFKLLTTISDNVTTTFVDSVADGSLGATASARVQAGITLSDPY